MKILTLIKDIDIKSLVTGDKSARIVLELLNPKDISLIASLGDKQEVWVEFEIDKPKQKE
jgi:hypothetical protein